MEETTEQRARRIVVEHLGVEPRHVTAEAGFMEDLGADSLDVIELVMAFEEAFGIEINDDEAEAVKTFGDALALVERKLAALGSAA